MLKDWDKRLCRKVRYASSELEKAVKAINTYSQDLLPAGIDFETQLSSLTNEELVEKARKLNRQLIFVNDVVAQIHGETDWIFGALYSLDVNLRKLAERAEKRQNQEEAKGC